MKQKIKKFVTIAMVFAFFTLGFSQTSYSFNNHEDPPSGPVIKFPPPPPPPPPVK
jgi:hypothetical protein